MVGRAEETDSAISPAEWVHPLIGAAAAVPRLSIFDIWMEQWLLTSS